MHVCESVRAPGSCTRSMNTGCNFHEWGSIRGHSSHGKVLPSQDDLFFLHCVTLFRSSETLQGKIEGLMLYLESFPLGTHNGSVAQDIEMLMCEISDPQLREQFFARFRQLRDPYMPPIQSMNGSFETMGL